MRKSLTLKVSRSSVRFTVAVFLIVAAGLFAVSKSGADAASSCTIAHGASYPSEAAAQACGLKTFPLAKVAALPGGGNEYVYTVKPGLDATMTIPPTGFNPITASIASLKEYGFPLPPATSDVAKYKSWTEAVSNNVYPPPPSFMVSPPITATCTPDTGYSAYQCSAGTGTSSNWSGVLDSESSSTYFTQSYAEYEEPTPPTSNTCNSSMAVFWAGLGGSNVSDLAQDGTIMGSCTISDGSMWWEILPTYSTIVVPGGSYTTSAMDNVISSVTYTGSGNYGIYIKDVASGVTFSSSESGGSGVYNGATSEIIAERPSLSGSLTNLENYGTFNVWDGYSTGGSGNLIGPFGLWNFYNLTMLNGTDDLSDVTTAPVQSSGATGGFVTTWHLAS